jgi:hypothetical protein
MTSPRNDARAMVRSLCHLPSGGPFVRPKSRVGWEMNNLPRAGRGGTAAARRAGSATTRRGDYEGSWDERARPSFFRRLRNGVGVRSEDGGRAARPVDDPLRRTQEGKDAVPLHGFQGGSTRCCCRSRRTRCRPPPRCRCREPSPRRGSWSSRSRSGWRRRSSSVVEVLDQWSGHGGASDFGPTRVARRQPISRSARPSSAPMVETSRLRPFLPPTTPITHHPESRSCG